MKKALLLLAILISGNLTHANDRSQDFKEIATYLTIASSGPFAYCTYRAINGSKPAKTFLKLSAYVISTLGLALSAGASVFIPNLSLLERSACAATACLFGIGFCISCDALQEDPILAFAFR